MNADVLVVALFLGALLGALGGILNGIVDGTNEPRQWMAGIVGGIVGAAFLAPINPVARVDLLLLALFGFLAADVYENLLERQG